MSNLRKKVEECPCGNPKSCCCTRVVVPKMQDGQITMVEQKRREICRCIPEPPALPAAVPKSEPEVDVESSSPKKEKRKRRGCLLH